MKRISILRAVDASSNITTLGCEVGDFDKYSFHIQFSSATLKGTLQLQASNDNADWINVNNGSQGIAGGESHLWNVTAAAYQWARFTWTTTAGTGTISAEFLLKETPGK